MNIDKKHSFSPSIAPGARILILGSMPGEESLRQQQYYAYRHNVFWKIMGTLLNFDPALPYENRLEILRTRGIGLWDTLQSCRRKGSLDTEITDPVPNLIPDLLKTYPSITHIFCNGSASFRFLKQCFPELFNGKWTILRLPSTSPAAAVYRFEEKLDAYRILMNVLESK